LAIDQRFINVANGMLEWEVDRLHSHSPEFHSINQLAAEYDPAATCPTIDAWLADVLHPDLLEPNSEGRVPIDEVLGYLVVSGNPFHKAILLLGSGRNGKGTFIRLVEAMLGAHNVSSVTLSDLVNNRFRGADLYGKLANIAGDIDAGWLESTAMFKAVTGGDLISAEIKFGQPFTFTPTAVPLFSANGVFRTPDTSDGYLARWLVIEFPNSFVGREDRSLDVRLQAETSGLLNRAINGLRTLLPAGNFAMVESILASRRAFERANDPVRAFIEDCTVKDPTGFVSRQDISRLYNGWMEEEGGNPLSREKLYERLKTAGLREGRTRTDGRGFHGIRLTHRVGMLGMLEPLATVDELD
jgi:putative DNA primase/helicase